MPGAEARSSKPRYKEYKQIPAAQNFAQRLGVQEVDYGGRLDIANNANHALFLAHERGVPMPRSFVVRHQFTTEGGGNDYGAYHAEWRDAPGVIYIQSGRDVWRDIEAAMPEGRRRNLFSTADPRHFIMHELGELALHQSLGWERYNLAGPAYQEDERAFRELDRDMFRETVSRYAATNHLEFVAEVFAGLLLGRDELRDDPEILEAFERFGGERMLEWTKIQR